VLDAADRADGQALPVRGEHRAHHHRAERLGGDDRGDDDQEQAARHAHQKDQRECHDVGAGQTQGHGERRGILDPLGVSGD
jgi:hypothetical protein